MTTTTYRFLFGRSDHKHVLEYSVSGPGHPDEPEWRVVGHEPDRPYIVTWDGSFYNAKTVLMLQRAFGDYGRERPRHDSIVVYGITEHLPDGEDEVDEHGKWLGKYLYFRAERLGSFTREDLTKGWGR